MPGAEAEHGRAAQKLLAVELSSDQLVDDVVLERACFVPAIFLDLSPRLTIHLSVLPPVVSSRRSRIEPPADPHLQ